MKLNILLIIAVSCAEVWAQTDVFELHLPQVQTENFQLLKGDDMKFTLSLSLPNSERSETIYFGPLNAEQILKGSLNTNYEDTMSHLIVDYVADRNGYRASYNFGKNQLSDEVSFEPRLSSNDLKSLAG